MKKIFSAPKCKIVEIDMKDIIATSDTSPRIGRGGYSDTEEDGL